MSLVVPVEFVPVKQNGQFCADGGRDFELVSATSAIQMMGVPPMQGTRIPSSFSGLASPHHLPVTQRFALPADELGFSKTLVQNNVRCVQTNITVSSSKYIGLPYQDHNYVQLPPSTPPLSPSSSSPNMPTTMVQKPNPLIDDISYHTTVITTPDDSITRCICEFQHDDGYMIQCDKCGVWQHVDCMEVDRDNIPESYMCELCEPRKVDKHKAIQIQTNKRDALSLQRIDSSATETEEETTDGRRRSFDKSPLKKEPKEVGNGTNVGTLALNKKRKSKSKRDERLKRKLTVRRQSNGQPKMSISSPKKTHFESMIIDSFGETVRQDAALPQNGALVMPVSSLNSNPAAIEVYQEAISNQYTVELQNLLASIKFNGQQPAACSPSVYERLQYGPPSCLLAPVSNTRMGLEACEDMLTNQPLIEYIGKVMLRDQYDKDSFFYFRPEPHVLFYSKLGGLDLCIDASLYGNIARFVRRSCTPNAEVRHLLEGSTVRFFLCATKSIVRGAEITIPFDFNYHKCCYAVDCACTRISCPVAKFQRREGSHASGPTTRRQRSARSLEVAPSNPDNAVLSPRKLPTASLFPSPLASSVLGAAKHGKMQAPSSFRPEAVPEIDIVKTEFKPEPDAVKLEPLSPTWQLPSVPLPVVTQESSVPSSSATAAVTSSTAAANDADENDKSKKKTREEKKLEAVMKMFERLEKQQERKKEAQSRHEQGRGKEMTKSRESRKSKEKSENRNNDEMTFDAKQLNADVASNFKEQTVTTLPENVIRVELKPKLRRSKHSAASRRASMSAVTHTMTNFIPPSVALLNNNDTLETTGLESPVSVSNVTAESAVSPVYLSNASALETATSLLALSAERWTGYPKKMMMKGQDLHKQLTIKTDGLETSSNSEGDSGKEFVQCIPSPHSCSLNALRRNSMPAFSNNNGTPGINGKAALLVATAAVNGTAQADSKGCSAKKRWLQQAMCDRTELQPIGEEAVAGNGQMVHSSISPTDFVTPLKKRRLARESLSMESPPPTVQQDDNTSTCNTFPLYESISDDDHVDADMTPSSAERVVAWDTSLVVNQTDFAASRKDEKPIPESGLLRTRMPLSVNARQTVLHPDAYLLMPVGYQCQPGDNRSIGNTISSSVGITSTSNGFGNGISVDLAGVQAWQKSIPESVTSGINSGLVVANPYYSSGYLSGLVPGGQKQDSLNMAGLMGYRLAFSNIDPAYNTTGNSSGHQMVPLTVGLSSSNTGSANAVYLNKQIAGQTVNSEMSPASNGYPMSLFRAIGAPNCDVQGIMALAEAACRSREKTAENRPQTSESTLDSPRERSDEGFRENSEASSNLSYSFSLANSDQIAKSRSYFGTTQASNYIGGNLNHLLSLHGNLLTPSASDLSVNGSSVDHCALRENGASLSNSWREVSVCNGSGATATKSSTTGCTTDIPGIDMLASASPSALSSPTSTSGQCISKKKVSLHEYKMRRKSGSTGQGRLSSGSGSAPDSEASLSQSFDAATSPLNCLTSNTVSPDANRDSSESLSLAWSSNATEAEKALENLSSNEKLFKIDKGNASDYGSSSASCVLLNRASNPPGAVSTVQSMTSATEAPGTSLLSSDAFDSSSQSGVFHRHESQSDQQQAGTHGTVLTSDHSTTLGAGTTPVPASTSATTDSGHATLNALNVQTSDFSRVHPMAPL